MTTQKPISKSPISDAFLSKNAEGNYLSNGCFCARCKNITSFPFTGKEKDPETGYSYFGARYLEYELMSMWLSVDPMSDKYPSISPYAYCAWNPVKLVDPDGNELWKPDKNGNLVAEKGDNAWTLADYLNTTVAIATTMLEEQGFSVNSKGVLNLKVDDVFEVDNGDVAHLPSNNIGMIGRKIFSYLHSGIEKDCFVNYWNKGGDMKLTGKQYAGILLYIKNNPNCLTTNGETWSVNFYGNSKYTLAFGRAEIKHNEAGRYTGFYDKYDFNAESKGTRSGKNEIKTRLVSLASSFCNRGLDYTITF